MSRRYRERKNKKIHLTINTRILPGADRTRSRKETKIITKRSDFTLESYAQYAHFHGV